MFEKLRDLLPANRVALLLGLLGSVAAFITSLQTNLVAGSPAAEALGKAAGAVASIVMALKLVDKFLDGAQNFDTLLLSGAPKVSGVTVPPPNAAADDTVDIETPDYVGPDANAPEPNAIEDHPMYQQEQSDLPSRLSGFDRPNPEDEKQ